MHSTPLLLEIYNNFQQPIQILQGKKNVPFIVVPSFIVKRVFIDETRHCLKASLQRPTPCS
jgi:hypothetical protein